MTEPTRLHKDETISVSTVSMIRLKLPNFDTTVMAFSGKLANRAYP